MEYSEESPFYRLLNTKYDLQREDEAIEILEAHPELASLVWPGPDQQGQPFVKGSTALHYAANDGKTGLMQALLERGADVNASDAHWFRSVLSWASNNARIDALQFLLDAGAHPDSLDALHAAAWGGSSQGADDNKDYVTALQVLIEAGADKNDSRHRTGQTPLCVALNSGHRRAIEYLRSIGARER